MPLNRRWILCFFLLLLGLSEIGCTPRMIRGTGVRATPRNRKVVSVIRRYEGILRAGNWPRLMSLLSPTYKRTYTDPALKKKVTIRNRQQLLSFLYQLKRQKFRFQKLKIDVEEIRYPSVEKAYVLLRFQSTHKYPIGKYRPGLKVIQGISTMVLKKIRGAWLIQKGGI